MLDGLEGKVAIVTGAGQGLGRSHCRELARQGVRILVNDVGPTAKDTAAEIEELGSEAIVLEGDVSDYGFAKRMIDAAVDRWGTLDILVNNAGVIRDRMLFNMDEDDFDLVVRVNLKGTFCTSKWAAVYWREKAKASETGTVYGRIVNTTSEASMIGSPGQPNYAPAKAGVTQLTLVAAQTLSRYGVTANAIAPRARTPMTETFGGGFDAMEGDWPVFGPENVSPLVAYLASPQSQPLNGQVLIVWGKQIVVVHGPYLERTFDNPEPWTPEAVAATLEPFYADRTPITDGFVMSFA